MWYLLKSEFQYKKYILLCGLGIITTVLAILNILNELTTPGEIMQVIINSSIIYFFFIGNLGGGSNKELKTGFTIHLPVPLRMIAIARLALMIIIPLCIVILWTIFVMPNMKEPLLSNILLMASLYGLCVCISLLQPIFRDLKYFLRSYHLKVSVFIAATILLVVLLAISGYLVLSLERFSNLLRSPYSAILFNIGWPILAYVSVLLFQKRRSYLS